MSLDLALDDAQQAIAEAVAAFCRDACPDEVVKELAGTFPAQPWKGLAELGILTLLTPEGEGGAVELVAAMEALGRAVFPGPLAATFFATQVLPEKQRAAVSHGEAVVSLGVPPLMPWTPAAQLFLELEGEASERVWLARARGAIATVDTLGGEPWGRVELEREAELDGAGRAFTLHDLARAAYLAAAGDRLVADTAEHARTRRQFGKPIGEFQAVAHPLADCTMSLAAAQTLARAAAFQFDEGDEENARASAAAARLSASRAAVETAYVCHQLFGALGVTLEGPVFHVSRRIRQLASEPPGPARARDGLLASFDL